MTINLKQIQLIKTIISKLAIPDDIYREILANNYSVTSCKDLTQAQAKEFINFLKREANNAGLNFPQQSFNKHKHNNLAGRDNMATPKQLRKIEAMWLDYTNDTDEEGRTKRLNAFLFKKFKVSHIKFLTKDTVSKVIYCLGKILEQKNKQAC